MTVIFIPLPNNLYKSNRCYSSDILPEEIEEQVKELAEVSMGTDVSEDDMSNIMQLADQVIEITEYRAQLYEYLKVTLKLL